METFPKKTCEKSFEPRGRTSANVRQAQRADPSRLISALNVRRLPHASAAAGPRAQAVVSEHSYVLLGRLVLSSDGGGNLITRPKARSPLATTPVSIGPF